MSTNLQNMSRYFQTTHLLRASSTLSLPNDTQIRFLSADEATKLSAEVRRKNVFAAHSSRPNFYRDQIESLADRTVIETQRQGEPDEVVASAQFAAEWAEKVGFLSATLAVRRSALHRATGIDVLRQFERAITIGPRCYTLRAKSRRRRTKQGIEICTRFVNRFNRCGFTELYSECIASGGMSDRLRLVLEWLSESRQEPHASAALVKTSIALESLLIFSESESLARSLSERSAFILTPNPLLRKRISAIVKRFYEARSGIVHGSRKKAKKLTPTLLDGMDRLVVLLCLIVASNAAQWKSKEDLQEWCEQERWGKPSSIKTPFGTAQLTNSIKLCEK